MNLLRPLLLIAALLSLAGCDQFNNLLNKQQREAKAVGAGCRLSGRSLEDCYKRNLRASRADIYAGWREMHDYMMQKKIDNITPSADGAQPAEEAAPAKESDKEAHKKPEAAPAGEKAAQ
ncbi:hypothetical protein ABWL39_12545 [Chitinivorax sp. PXF-14]|uniref:hypothetical protein n=1 Tax=Chitinivorax sp. PXF-14 TaxID=3230488 RepID=UPI00346724A3